MSRASQWAVSGRVVVVSPHLDDAVLSLGAAIAGATRRGGEVVVLTALAGDPASGEPAGRWDRRAGFATAGEACRARRAEDVRACAAVGAATRWLPFQDAQYGPPDVGELAAALATELAGAEVALAPGFPMRNPDHVTVARAFEEAACDVPRRGFYLEQPYDWWTARPQRRPSGALRWRQPRPGRDLSPLGRQLGWTPLPAAAVDMAAKLRACRRYRSQLPLLGRLAVERILLREARRGGEHLAWE